MFSLRQIPVRTLLFAGSAGALLVIGLEMLLVTVSPTQYVSWREVPVLAGFETVLLLGLAVFQFREATRRR